MHARALFLTLMLPCGPVAAAELASPYGFEATVARIEAAVEGNAMFRIATASASRAAAGQGIAIPGDAVVLVFRNDFARRVLAADPKAGIEAPLPFHVRETGGRVVIAWKKPSDVYRPYASSSLDVTAAELDAIFAKIAADAVAK
ncbi:MAG: DUF302 domain-containing protein [Rhodospirillales bacterium]|nr:DUF302 domain-containing protein [Rhodospirillales bacterium]